MKKLIQLAIAAVFLLTGTIVYCQQTQTAPADTPESALVKAAKRERERREKIKEAAKPTKSFTNQDIEAFKAKNKDADRSSSEEATEEETAAEETVEEPTTTAAPSDAENEELWRGKSRAANDRVKSAEEKIEQIQSDINALTQAFYAESDGVAQRGQIEAQRNDRLSQLDAAKKELEAAKQAKEDLVDEARRAGALPGWIEY